MISACLLAALSSALGLTYSQMLVRLLTFYSSNFVLAQTTTLAVFIGAMGIGAFLAERVRPRDLTRILPWLQFAMAATVVLGVAWILSFYFVYKFYFLEISSPRSRAALNTFARLFTAAAQPPVLLVGTIAGLELNCLVRWGRSMLRGGGTSRILAAGYFGTALASLWFIWIVPHAESLTLILGLATLNCLIGLITAWKFLSGSRRNLAVALGLLINCALCWGADRAKAVQDLMAKMREVQGVQAMSWLDLPRMVKLVWRRPPIVRQNTGYQTADFTVYADGNFRFSLDHHAQLEAIWVDQYHEGLIDMPIQLFREVPRQVLVLGGGDGIAAGQLLRYGNRIDSIDLVDLDPWMLEKAARHPFFTDLNHHSLRSPKVRARTGDAFNFLRAPGRRYDAIIIDFPLPFEAELTKLYSAEFYALVKRRLKPAGMMVLDTPLGCYLNDPLERGAGVWRNFSRNSLKQAGFVNITAYCAGDGFLVGRLDDLAPRTEAVDFGVEYHWLTHEIVAQALTADLPPWVSGQGRPNSVLIPHRPLRAREM